MISLWQRNPGCFDHGLGCAHPQGASPSFPPLKTWIQPSLASNETPTTSPAPKKPGLGVQQEQTLGPGSVQGMEVTFQRLWGRCGSGKGRAGEVQGMLQVPLGVLHPSAPLSLQHPPGAGNTQQLCRATTAKPLSLDLPSLFSFPPPFLPERR